MKYKLLAGLLLLSFFAMAQEFQYNYNFFTNSAMNGNFFFSKTTSSGNSFINNIENKLPVSETTFHTPGNALQLQYKNGANGNWQAIIFCKRIRGVDYFKTANYLSFWVFDSSSISSKGLPAVRLMKKDSSLTSSINIPSIKKYQWQQIIINTDSIKNFDKNKLTNNIAIVFSQQNNDGEQHTIFIDDIEFINKNNSPSINSTPEIIDAKGAAMHVDITWKKVTDTNIRFIKIYRSENGNDFKAVGIQQTFINRYADFTGESNKKYFYKIVFINNDYKESNLSSIATASTKTMTDDELLTMVQESSFHYYWDGAETHSGLTKEDIPGRQNMIAAGASGFGIMALIVGTERKFITHEEAVGRFIKIVNFLEHAEKFHGAFPHFIDGETGKVIPFFGKRDNGADLVETSFLMEGLLTARQYFSGDNEQEKMIRDKITTMWNNVEWSWFKINSDSKFLYWHWSPDKAWVIHHNLIGWNETMITYLLAIASPTHGVAASMYYSGWANQDSTGQKYRAAWSSTKDGSMYTNGNTYFGIKLAVGVSDGGPLFFTHYSYMGFDPHFINDKYANYFTNNQNIAKINYNYCVQNPKHYKGYGDNAWGLTASDGPFDYSADEPVLWEDHGKIAPTGAISSFPYTPEESMKALKNYYYNYGKFLWGEYGFKDAFDLTNNWCSEIYMGLNQAPITVMIENYRSGLIWKLFMSNADIKNGLQKLNDETNSKK